MNKKRMIAFSLTCVIVIIVVGLGWLEYQRYHYEQDKILDYRLSTHQATAKEIHDLAQYRKNLQLKYGAENLR